MDRISYIKESKRLPIPEKLLNDIHFQLKMNAATDNKGRGYDAISNYLNDYFKTAFQNESPELFQRYTIAGIGISGPTIERAIKGRKGIKGRRSCVNNSWVINKINFYSFTTRIIFLVPSAPVSSKI